MIRKLLGLLTTGTLVSAGALVAIATHAAAVQESREFSYTGGVQQFVVPPGVTAVEIELFGASGGNAGFDRGGRGGRTLVQLEVTPSEVLRVVVGGRGSDGEAGGAGGFNGGGGPSCCGPFSGGGGGASDVRQGGGLLTHRVAVAGGGGGAAFPSDANVDGGDGGGRFGAAGGPRFAGATGGGGASDVGGGSGGTGLVNGQNTSGQSGTLLQGGAGGSFGNGVPSAGGGGGGYYGGGGGATSNTEHVGAGGGGSGFDATGFGETGTSDHVGHGEVRITYGTLPDAPMDVLVRGGDGQASVQFRPPADFGGSPILDYTATCGTKSATSTNNFLVVTGLTNDVTVPCTVTARNAVGTGAASPQVTVTPGTVPGAPTNVSATALKGGASISFTPPTYLGPGPVLYSATCRDPDGGFPNNSSNSSPIIVNLSNSTYTCTVQAHNDAGFGPESSPPIPVTPLPLTVSSAPTLLALHPGDHLVESRATFPEDDGGDFPDTFTLTCVTTEGDATQTFSASNDFLSVVLTGLPNGTPLRCTERATNSVGDSPESNALTVTLPTESTTPSAVQNLVTTVGPGRVAFAFDPPASDGGTPIMHYFVVCASIGGGSSVGSGAIQERSYLLYVGGGEFDCSAFARNANGISPAVTHRLTLPDPTVPHAPSGVSATAGDARATVQFAPPDDDGGSVIDGYVATCGNQSALGAESPIVVRNLANGVAVECTVAAVNNVGIGPSSSPPVSVTPGLSGSAPGAPRNVAAARGSGQATVSFSPPTSDGGNTIIDYTATCGAQSATGPGSPLVVTGLTNGVTVSCTVTARNAIGTGPASSPPVSVKPATVPGVPLTVAATPGNTQATVTFAKPTSNGGSGILDYTATCGTKSKTGTGSPLVVTGLANGTTVSCTVRARNALGSGPASSPVSVRPATVPGAPLNVTASPANTQAIVKFNKPVSNGGSPITGYTATCGTKTRTGAGSPLVVSGLVNGLTVQCTVRASNAIGTGPASSPPVSVTPRP